MSPKITSLCFQGVDIPVALDESSEGNSTASAIALSVDCHR
jgi:hypothetical protein